MKLIVGLGNPGKEYQNTRHNVGFIILDNYGINGNWIKEKNYEYQSMSRNNEKIILLKPMTYMNLSGHAVSLVKNYYKINVEDILVIHDDLYLPNNTYRLKKGSSSGGHNGIKDIIEQLGTNNFCHLKVGIGHNKNMDTKDYVLNKLDKDEIQELTSDKYTEIINFYLDNGIDKTMNKYNSNGV